MLKRDTILATSHSSSPFFPPASSVNETEQLAAFVDNIRKIRDRYDLVKDGLGASRSGGPLVRPARPARPAKFAKVDKLRFMCTICKWSRTDEVKSRQSQTSREESERVDHGSEKRQTMMRGKICRNNEKSKQVKSRQKSSCRNLHPLVCFLFCVDRDYVARICPSCETGLRLI